MSRFEALVSLFPLTYKGDICCSSLIYDGSSMPKRSNIAKVSSMSKSTTTLPQQLPMKGWYLVVGLEFQQGRTRFRTYNNLFDAGVVLPRFIDQGSFHALKHNTTTINISPDPGEMKSIMTLFRCALSLMPPSSSLVAPNSGRNQGLTWPTVIFQQIRRFLVLQNPTSLVIDKQLCYCYEFE